MFLRCESCKKNTEVGIVRDTLKNNLIQKQTEVRCLECGSEVITSSFTKQSLLTSGKFYKIPTSKQAFSFKCDPCGKVEPAVLSEDQKNALCSICKKTLNLSPIMINAIRLSKQIPSSD